MNLSRNIQSGLLTPTETGNKFNNTITMRKTPRERQNGSMIILETHDKKISFNIKNDKDFLDSNFIGNNLNIMKSIDDKSKLELNEEFLKELDKSIDNVSIKNKNENENEIILKPHKIKKAFSFIDKNKINSNNEKELLNQEIKKSEDETNKEKITLNDNKESNDLYYKMKIHTHSSIEEEEPAFDINYIKKDTFDLGNNKKITEPGEYHNTEEQDKFDDKVYGEIKKDKQLYSERLNISDNNKNSKKIEKEKNETSSNSSQRKSLILISKTSSKINIIQKELLIPKEKTYEDREPLKSDSSEIPFRICFICDQFFLKDKIYSAEHCEHTFCRRCGKAFYEEKIEQGDISFICPVYNCDKIVEMTNVQTLVSEKHFSTIDSKTEKMKNTIQVYNNYLKKDSVKFYSKKHVLDINTNESFFIYNKAKENFCIKCSEPALYGKSGKYIVKCLNCYHTICKFCMKSFTADHFEITSFNYCKVYFRRRLRKGYPKDKSFCKSYLFVFALYIASYLMICLAIFKYINVFSSKMLCYSTKNSNNFKSFCFYLMFIILCLVAIPLMLMMIPYFPLITNLMSFI